MIESSSHQEEEKHFVEFRRKVRSAEILSCIDAAAAGDSSLHRTTEHSYSERTSAQVRIRGGVLPEIERLSNAGLQ